jgi:hypothetical protein
MGWFSYELRVNFVTDLPAVGMVPDRRRRGCLAVVLVAC